MKVNERAQAQWQSEDGTNRLIRHFESSAEKQEAEELVAQWVADVPHQVVVDLGCGPGRMAAVLPKTVKTYRGYDTSEHFLAVAKATFGDRKHVFRQRDLFEGASYRKPADVLLAIGLTRHYDEPINLARVILDKWPAKHYIFDFLHHDRPREELINGVCLNTADLLAALPDLGYIIRRQDQMTGNRIVTYVMLGERP